MRIRIGKQAAASAQRSEMLATAPMFNRTHPADRKSPHHIDIAITKYPPRQNTSTTPVLRLVLLPTKPHPRCPLDPALHTTLCHKTMPPPSATLPSSFGAAPASSARTLVLCPPSIAAHPEALEKILSTSDRASTDVQMLDRLALNLVSLPAATYSLVLQPADAACTPTPALLAKILAALAPGGRWRSPWAGDRLLFLTAGFLVEDAPAGPEAVKPDFGGQKVVALGLRKRPASGRVAVVKPVVVVIKIVAEVYKAHAGGLCWRRGCGRGHRRDDDGLIDEEELMADENLATPVHMRKPPFLIFPRGLY